MIDWPHIDDALGSEMRNAWADFQAENALHPCEPPPSFIEGYRRALERQREGVEVGAGNSNWRDAVGRLPAV